MSDPNAPNQPPPYTPPPGPPPQYYPPQSSPGYIPPPIAPAAAGIGLLGQFRGRAMWSIIAGLVSIVVPFFTTFYFPILPILAFIYAIQAIRRGQLIGGIIGLVLSILGGIVSWLDSPLSPLH